MNRTEWKKNVPKKKSLPEKNIPRKKSLFEKNIPRKISTPRKKSFPEKQKNPGKKNSPGDVRKIKRYGILHAAEMLILAGVIAVAFFTPQVLFYIQDRILWGRQELSRREGMDVEALSSTYEKSLYQRMSNYAEGLAAGDDYYVTAKTLTTNQELEEYLYSNKGLYHWIMDFLISSQILPNVFWESDCTVEQWKQYVIYSDNYTKGVNFILWYIELSSADDIHLKLLADAESGTLYGLKTENCQWIVREGFFEQGFFEQENRLGEEGILELWSLCALYFEAFSSESDLIKDIQKNLGSDTENSENKIEADVRMLEELRQWLWRIGAEEDIYDSYTEGSEISFEYAFRNSDFVEYILDKVQIREENTDALITFQIPYGRFSLDMTMRSGSRREGVPEDIPDGYFLYPDTVIGVRQIYEMIPEFS